MNNFIFNPTNKQKQEPVSELYCLMDSHDFLDDQGKPILNNNSDKVLAKVIFREDNRPTFFVKIANNNKLYNPLDYGLQDKSYSIVDNVCRPQDKFKIVNEEVFNLYTNFLTSKNTTWLTQAERGMI